MLRGVILKDQQSLDCMLDLEVHHVQMNSVFIFLCCFVQSFKLRLQPIKNRRSILNDDCYFFHIFERESFQIKQHAERQTNKQL